VIVPVADCAVAVWPINSKMAVAPHAGSTSKRGENDKVMR
jgi:hypothetical protein